MNLSFNLFRSMRSIMNTKLLVLSFLPILWCGSLCAEPTAEQLAGWLKRFPAADANGDGVLTVQEAQVYRTKLERGQVAQPGAPKLFKIDSGWDADRFPEHAICHQSPQAIAELYAKLQGGGRNLIPSYDKPKDGSLRIVATGHSFMVPGFRTFPGIAKAAGLEQPPLMTHTGGGITGSAQYKWEQENGIFQFDKKPVPKLLASISNAQWDAMLWGPYYYDRPAFYTCWIDFCLKHNPNMKFYLMNAWPQLGQLEKLPTSEEELTAAKIAELGKERKATYDQLVRSLNEKHDGRVYILPTCEAMVLAAPSISTEVSCPASKGFIVWSAIKNAAYGTTGSGI